LAGALIEEVEEVEEEVQAPDMIDLLDPLTGKVYRVPRESKARTSVQRIAVAHAVSTSYISECVSWLRARGKIGNAFGTTASSWRQLPATKAQLDLLARRASRYKNIKCRPEPVAKAIAYAYDLLLHEHKSVQGEPTLRRGIMTDFLSLDEALTVRGEPGDWDLSLQDSTIAALFDCPVDSGAVIAATVDAKNARRAK
jgi:hypothetical protein